MSKTDIQKEIEDTIASIVHLDVVIAQHEETQQELNKNYDELEKMNKSMSHELRDIEKLEGLSTKAIFHKILGNKEEQLEKERQEYLELTLKYEKIQKNIELLEFEVNLLEAKIGNRENLEGRLSTLKGLREAEIIEKDPVLRKKMLDLSLQLEKQYEQKKMLQEAIEAGNICSNLMGQIINQLRKVQNWGSFGSNRRGGMQRLVRRDAIDRARNLSYQVKHHLQLLERELNDLGVNVQLGIDNPQFNDFTDFFFNNIITDWILQQKLTKAITSVNHTRQRVAHIISQLSQDLSSCQIEIDQLKSTRENILIS